MTDTPETRTTYWWSAEQLRAAGWRLARPHVKDEDGNGCFTSLWHRNGDTVRAELDRRNGTTCAYLPEPPPPEELSDDELRAWCSQVLCAVDSVSAMLTRDDRMRLENVLDAVLQWDIGQRERVGHCLLEEREALSRALRQRPR